MHKLQPQMLDTSEADLRLLLNQLIEKVQYSPTGWGNYRDTSTGQQLPANTRTQLLNNGGLTDEGQLPDDVDTFWADNQLVAKMGDAFVIRVFLVVTPVDSTASTVVLDVDVGLVPPIEQQEFAVVGGTGDAQPISFTFLLFARDSFVANGARIFVTCDGAVSVTGVKLMVARIHRGVPGL